MDETKRQEIIKFFASMSDESLALSYELSLAYILKKKNSGSDNLVLPSFEDIQGNGSLEPEVSRPAPPEVEIPAQEPPMPFLRSEFHSQERSQGRKATVPVQVMPPFYHL